MITRLVVEHYKSIEHADLHLGKLVLFVGPNGSGKSNLIDAMRFVRDAALHGLDRAVAERHGIDSIRQWSPSKPYFVSLRAEVENAMGRGHLSFTLSSYKGNHSVRREDGSWCYHDSRLRPALFYWRHSDGSIRVRDDSNPVATIPIEQPEELFVGQFEARMFRPLVNSLGSMEAYSIYPNVLRTPQKSSSEGRLSSNGDNLTSVFKLLAKSKRQTHIRARTEIISGMRKVMPTLDTIRIQSLGGLMVPVFRVQEQNEKVHDFNVEQISDGTLRVLGLLTALYQPSRPDVVAMEEPEQTVNPGVLAVLAEAIEETSTLSQTLVTTHSPEFLDKFDPSLVLAVEMEQGITKVGPVSEDQKLAVRERLFSLGELMAVEGLHL